MSHGPGRLLSLIAVSVSLVVGAAWWITRTAATSDESLPRPSAPAELSASASEAMPLPSLPAINSETDLPAAVPASAPEPLLQSYAVDVTVVDMLETPVADARVDVWEVLHSKDALGKAMKAVDLDEFAKLTDEEKNEWVSQVYDVIEGALAGPPRLSLRTDSLGRCTIVDATDETLLVAQKYDVGTSGRVEALGPSLTVKLRPTARVHGVVRDEDDLPVAGATVRIEAPGTRIERTGPRIPQPALTNIDGRFQMAVDAGMLGRARAFVGSPERASAEEIFSVEPGEDKELDLFFADGTISGRVTWDDGQPVRGGSVTARIEADPSGTWRGDPFRMAILGADGNFRLDGLRFGSRYSVRAHTMAPAGVSTERFDIDTGTNDLVLVLSRKDAQGVTLRGRVVDMETGEPVRRFETSLTMWSSPHRMKMPNQKAQSWEADDGRFEMPRLPVEWAWALEIRAPDFEPAIFGPLHPVNDTELELGLGRAGGLSVNIVDTGGSPVAAANVALFREVTLDGNDLTAPIRGGVTAADGRCTWIALAPGPYWLIGANASGSAGPVRVDVPSGREGSAQVQLSTPRRDVTVRVSLLDREGRPFPNIDVNVLLNYSSRLGWQGGESSAESEEQAFMTDASGIAVAESLLPGIYAVSVLTDDVTILPHFVVAEPGAQLEVKLEQQ